MGIVECWPCGEATKIGRVGKESGIQSRSNNSYRGAPGRIGKLPSQGEEYRNRGMECGMK